LNSISYILFQLGGWLGGWMAIYLEFNHVPEYLSFSKLCSERSFLSCNIFFDGPTDRPTNLFIEAPCRSLKSQAVGRIILISWFHWQGNWCIYQKIAPSFFGLIIVVAVCLFDADSCIYFQGCYKGWRFLMEAFVSYQFFWNNKNSFGFHTFSIILLSITIITKALLI